MQVGFVRYSRDFNRQAKNFQTLSVDINPGQTFSGADGVEYGWGALFFTGIGPDAGRPCVSA
jgi:hypothetical protein